MTISTRAMQPADWALLRHFTKAEFKDPDRMGFQFMLLLDRMRTEAGVPFRITSSFRTKAHNKEVGGAKDSAHTDEPICEAADISPLTNFDRYHIMRAAFVVGFQRIGIYKDGSMHVDSTQGRRPAPRLWCVVDNPA